MIIIIIRILILGVITGDAYFMERKVEAVFEYENTCRNITAEPFFLDELVVGKIWTIYFAWNMVLRDDCLDIVFRKADIPQIDLFRKNMHKYLSSEPNWYNATLIMTMDETREMLLIPDDAASKNNTSGRFVGVPNIHRGGYMRSRANPISLFKLVIKLLHEGRYLIMSDCMNGVISFLVGSDQRHTRGEIAKALAAFDFGDEPGYPACKFNLKKT